MVAHYPMAPTPACSPGALEGVILQGHQLSGEKNSGVDMSDFAGEQDKPSRHHEGLAAATSTKPDAGGTRHNGMRVD
jgi:hypothetical protein